MKKEPSIFPAILLAMLSGLLLLSGCQNKAPEAVVATGMPAELTHADLLSKGKYLVNGIGCGDCHTPKKFTAQGPVPDSTRVLSGYVSGSPLPPIDKKALHPGYWLLFNPELTACFGPWGITYSANLTPDSLTGLGTWTEDNFIKTLRTGKHLGQEGGRPLLPPMPWQDFSSLSDQDLRAIFVYLQSLPAINNKVPAPKNPAEVAAMN